MDKFNINPSKTQDTLCYPSAETDPKILFNIDRIVVPWQTLFYITAWKMTPPLFSWQITKSANAKIVAEYTREFKCMAYVASIVVGRGARVSHVFKYLHHSDERVIPERDKARALMAAYLDSQFVDGAQ